MVTEIKSYQCDICGTSYDTIEEAIECESKGIVQAKRSIGETLRIIPRYLENGERFVERKIIGVKLDNRGWRDPDVCRPAKIALHHFGYEIDQQIQIGKDLWVGEYWGLLYDQDLEWCEYRPDNPDYKGYLEGA